MRQTQPVPETLCVFFYQEEMQYTHRRKIEGVHEQMLPWKSNKYYTFLCVCVRARAHFVFLYMCVRVWVWVH